MEKLNPDLDQIFSQINGEWLERLHRLNDQAFNRASKKGQVDLTLLVQTPQIAVVRLVYGRFGNSHHLACIVPRETVHLGEIRKDDDIWEIVTEEKEITPDVIAKELPTYIHMYYPQASGLPINIYRSKRDFQNKVPLRRVSFENDLVVIKKT